MKKIFAMVLAAVLVMMMGACALAENGITEDAAKDIAQVNGIVLPSRDRIARGDGTVLPPWDRIALGNGIVLPPRD